MSLKITIAQAISITMISLVLFLGGFVFGLYKDDGRETVTVHPLPNSESPSTTTLNFLPAIINRYPWMNPFGVESTQDIGQDSALFQKAVELRTRWIRLNNRISWRDLQPLEGGPVAWEKLAQFENELRAIRSSNMTPLVVVDDYPYWAVEIVRNDGKPTSCGPLKTDKFTAFAQFLRQLVNRYQVQEFNVHNWELGNEPDIDPDLVLIDSQFGCWGNDKDPYYGGQHYGEMIKVVAPAIRTGDPAASIWLGGLLLASPQSNNPQAGHPEFFLQGILQSGAASSFDIVPYHWYPSYQQIRMDYDLGYGTDWEARGGGTVGKARFLRSVMQSYSISKPLSMNETGLGCPYDWVMYDWCKPPAYPDSQFFDMQADYIVRSFTRGYNEGVASMMWYTLNGPGWRSTGLLDGTSSARPAYYAYQTLISKLQDTHRLGAVHYSAEIEGYAFQSWHVQLQILWTVADTYQTISIPQAYFIAAYNRQGILINPTLENGNYQISVGFSPIYIVRNP
jgi:hypothetical protein